MFEDNRCQFLFRPDNLLNCRDHRIVPQVVWRTVLLMNFTEHCSHEMLHGKSICGQINLGHGTCHVESPKGCLQAKGSARSHSKESYLSLFIFQLHLITEPYFSL